MFGKDIIISGFTKAQLASFPLPENRFDYVGISVHHRGFNHRIGIYATSQDYSTVQGAENIQKGPHVILNQARKGMGLGDVGTSEVGLATYWHGEWVTAVENTFFNHHPDRWGFDRTLVKQVGSPEVEDDVAGKIQELLGTTDVHLGPDHSRSHYFFVPPDMRSGEAWRAKEIVGFIEQLQDAFPDMSLRKARYHDVSAQDRRKLDPYIVALS